VKELDCNKVGKLILSLRSEKNMTQKELADMMNISDRTISKWERGAGCPDVSLLSELSKILGVDIDKILSGDLEPNDKNGGNMKKTKFYICPNCGNVLLGSGEADISCCGRKLSALAVKAASENHIMTVEENDGEYYIKIDHEMTKTHFISFVAFVGYDRVLLVKLYPEQNAELRIPQMPGGKLYAYCSEHGLLPA
jgi:DNA-binding XRE family transcriptional regulator/desulfoferrodoxin (superoxide reductase-like protein)